MYLTWLGALAVYLLHLCTDIEGSCEDQVEQAQFDGKVVGKYEDKCYAFSRSMESFFGAREVCKTLNGDLATIPSQQMSTVLSKILPPNRAAYVGATDMHQRNVWEWLNGDPVTWTNWYDEKAILADSDSPDAMRCLVVVNFGSVVKWDVASPCSIYSNQYLCEYDDVEQTSVKPQTDEIPVTEGTASKTKAFTPQVFLGRKEVAGVYNPRLKAKSDDVKTAEGKEECLRLCYEHADCVLVNFHYKGHCGMYRDQAQAESLGADHEPGWSVWVAMGEQTLP